MQLKVYEVLEKVRLAQSTKDKLKILRQNSDWALKQILFGTFNHSVQFYRNDTPDSYKPDIHSPVEMGYSNLNIELKKMWIFVKTGNPSDCKLRDLKKDEILLQLLESLEAREAQVVINMFSKDLHIDGLTYELVNEAFPGLL